MTIYLAINKNINKNKTDQIKENSWINLDAYGLVKLVKKEDGVFIQTRTSLYKVPQNLNDSDAIKNWTIKAIEKGWINSSTYPPKITNIRQGKIYFSNHRFDDQGKFEWLEFNQGRLKVGKNFQGEVIVKTKTKNYITPPGIAGSTEKIKLWLESKKITHQDFYPKKIIPETDTSKIWIGRQNGDGSAGFNDFKALENEPWLGTKFGQVNLGTSQSLPKKLMIKTKGEGYYYVPDQYSKSRYDIKNWIEEAIGNGSINTDLYPTKTQELNIKLKSDKDLIFYYNTSQKIVDDEYHHSITSPVRPPKGQTGDFTLRVQPWRGPPLFWKWFNTKEQLVECKLISTAGRPGCDLKTKWIISDSHPALKAILEKINAKIEFETSGSVRWVNGQVLGQGAAAFKLNISHPQPESLIRLVVGLEFPQFSAPMMPIVQRVLPHLTSLYHLLINPSQDRAEFFRKFDEVASQILIPITMLGGQISLVYPANNAIKKALSIGSSISASSGFYPLAALLKGAEGGLSGLEKATGFNIRIGYTYTLRDPLVQLKSGHFVDDDSRHVLLVGKNTQGKIITAERLEFARQIFGDRFLDPYLSEYANALFERGFNAFQVSTLIPLPQARIKTEKSTPDPEKAFRSPPPFKPQRIKYDKLMHIADQAVQAIIDLRNYLPSNALKDIPRIVNGYRESALAIQKSLRVIRSYQVGHQANLLEERFLSNLVNQYGIDWGIPELRQLNKKIFGMTETDPKVAKQIMASETPKYQVFDGQNGQAEIIKKTNDQSGKTFVFSIWHDLFNGKNKTQKRRIGLVTPQNPIGLKKSLDQSVR